MSNLYIYGGENKLRINSKRGDYLYHINTGNIIGEGTLLDDLKKVHKIALVNRDKYIQFINDLNEHFLKQNLIYENNISMFFFSDLFNKRSEFFNTYTDISHIEYLKYLLKNELRVKQIYLINCNDMFFESINSAFPQIVIKNKNLINSNLSLLKLHYSQLKFFFKTYFLLFFLRNKFNNPVAWKISGKLFLSRYPLCFDQNFNEDKYGRMVESNDRYLISIITDGMHQNLGLREYLNTLAKLNNKQGKVILLDKYIKHLDVIKALFQHFTLSKDLNQLIKKEYNFNGINISKYLQKELHVSFLRMPRLFMYRNSLINIFSKIKLRKFIFYLHEYSYGRFFNYILINYFPKIERIGFQHGPASKRKLLYFLGKNIVSNNKQHWFKRLPIPNKILAEDNLSANIYKEAGYSKIKIMNDIYRLDYLSRIKVKQNNEQWTLIVSGLHDSKALLNKILRIVKENPSNQYLFKPHPKTDISIHKLKKKIRLNNLEFVSGHITEYLGVISEVIATYSSVGYEAYQLGIKVTLVFLPNKINESPLLDIYEDGEKTLLKNIW